ncbi:hypothetical protein HJC23_003742 [Cyclotella cryptica]|uniref:Uncharacterized protein n=1 Tax=Cyclotella cryptica TaxID=29204 RepID=A0ABD3QTA2_9STRA
MCGRFPVKMRSQPQRGSRKSPNGIFSCQLPVIPSASQLLATGEGQQFKGLPIGGPPGNSQRLPSRSWIATCG